MKAKYICTNTVETTDDTKTTESMWIINGRMVIHTMTVENTSQDVISESVTDPNIDPTELVYDPNKTIIV